jgi:acyl carrier protein
MNPEDEVAITQIEGSILDFLSEEIIVERNDVELTVDTPLLTGLVDSWALVQIVTFLEEQFDLDVEPSEVVEENFGSVHATATFVRSKQRTATASKGGA